eukprot:TRINITY_DN1872_c0_g1_i3.p1 TRINITY_DN1872_c0_g1~~TRINITY_DN1872_c0_g1_i3.p1  ORF type:complete len:425 (+),score=30.54 TRINITY_DN1872_c0_g1_i3:740-2014(+)
MISKTLKFYDTFGSRRLLSKIPGNYEKCGPEFWKSKGNQIEYFKWLSDTMNIKNPEDWYTVKSKDIISKNGYGLLKEYSHSPYILFKNMIPNYDWKPWMFSRVPIGFWDSRDNQMIYIEWLKKKLNVDDPISNETNNNNIEMTKWYGITNKFIRDNHGSGILSKYNNSIFKMLSALYPDYPWERHKFQKVSKNFWKSPENIKSTIDSISKELGIVDPSKDWYRVSDKILKRVGLGRISVKDLKNKYLKIAYPHINWEVGRFSDSRTKKANQRWLLVNVKKLFPDEEIFEDFLHPKLVNPETGQNLEIDIWIPRHNIALEYQGESHYFLVPGLATSVEMYQARDAMKVKICNENNITLIPIPYWWLKDVSSLASTIISYRPDMVNVLSISFNNNNYGIPIPLEVDTEHTIGSQINKNSENINEKR